MLNHVVMVKIKEDCNFDYTCQLLEGLIENVPVVRSAVWGPNVLAATGAFDFVFILGLDDLEALAAYDRSDYHQLLSHEIQAIRSPRTRLIS